MAACLRSAVGFYNGGGVTPEPTPVPTTDLATYREIEWYGAPVKALCDVYGRLFTRYDSANDVYNGVAWDDEGLDKTFDSIEGHDSEFLTLINTYGHNDAVTGEGVDNVVINLDGTSTEFTFTDGQCVPVPSLWQQGAVKTLFYRTLNDGTNDINVLCDTDGKLIVGDGADPSYLEYTVASDQIGFRTANRDVLIAAAGGSVVVDVFSDTDGNYILVSLDGYTVVADLDGIVVQGEITEWPVSNLVRSIQVPYSGGNVNIPVDKYGRVMVKHVADGNVNYTPWWVDGNQIAVFDDAADQVLVDAMRDHGYVDCLSFTQASDITVTIDGQSENLVFDNSTKKFDKIIRVWQNGATNLAMRYFYLAGNTIIAAAVDTESGGLATINTNGSTDFIQVEISQDGSQQLNFLPLSDYPGLSEIAPTQKLLEFFEVSIPDIGDTDVLANTVGNNVFVIVVDQDGNYRNGSAELNNKMPLFRHVLDYGSNWNVASFYDDKYVVDGDDLLRIDDGTGKWFWAVEASAALPSGHTRGVDVTGRTSKYNGQFTVYGITYVMEDGVITPNIVPEV